MNKRYKIIMGIILFFTFIPPIMLWIVYNRLPNLIPMQWDANWHIARYGSKDELVFISFLSLIIFAVLFLCPFIDPRRKNYKRFEGVYATVTGTIVFYTQIFFYYTLFCAFNPNTVSAYYIMFPCIGVLICILGNYMPKFKSNFFLGVRTPWTLADERVWFYTHRFAGIIWFVAGIALCIVPFICPANILAVVVGIIVALIALTPVLYSYFSYRHICKSNNADK